MNKTIALIEKKLKHAKEYDSNGKNSTARFGRAAAAIEKQSVITMLEELLKVAKSEA